MMSVFRIFIPVMIAFPLYADFQSFWKFVDASSLPLKNKVIEIGIAAQEIRNVRSTVMPSINLGGGLNYHPMRRQFLVGSTLVPVERKWSSSFDFTFRQRLDFYRVGTALKAAKDYHGEKIADLEAARLSTFRGSGELYSFFSSLSKKETVLSNQLRALEEFIPNIRAEAKKGYRGEDDVIGWELRLLSLRRQITALLRQKRARLGELRALLGKPYLLVGSLDLPNLVRAKSENMDFETTPDGKKMKYRTEFLKKQKKLAKLDYLPHISFAFGISGSSSSSNKLVSFDANDAFVSSKIGLEVSIPLFSGLSRDAQVKKKNKEIASFGTLMKAEEERFLSAKEENKLNYGTLTNLLGFTRQIVSNQQRLVEIGREDYLRGELGVDQLLNRDFQYIENLFVRIDLESGVFMNILESWVLKGEFPNEYR